MSKNSATSIPRANCPRMMSARAIGREGLLAESAVRYLMKTGQIPVLQVGKKKQLVNYDLLVAYLQNQGVGGKDGDAYACD